MKRPAYALMAFFVACGSTLLAAPAPAPAANKANARIDFTITIADLNRAAASGDDKAIPGDKQLVIDAEIGSITTRVDTDDRFTAEVELVGGAWRGEEGIDMYRAYAVFDGIRYRDLFSRKSANRLSPGARVLVLCRYLGIGVDYDEKTPVSVLEAVELRRLD